MIASLPMYWRDETAGPWRAFWRTVQDEAALVGLTLPALVPPDRIGALTDHWLRPDLALSMTCGLPFRTTLRGRVTYVGTLGFGLDAPPGHYFSEVIARPDRLPDRPVLAFNAADSQSGWAVTQHAPPFDTPPVFGGYVKTGSHAGSLAAVAEGRADIAYLDAVTWRLLKRFDPRADAVRVIGRSIATPGLPLIAAQGTDPAPLRAALSAAADGFDPADPADIGGRLSFHVLDPEAYLAQPAPAPPPTG